MSALILEAGQRIASQRDRLILAGADPSILKYGVDKYGEVFLVAERIKREMRSNYARKMVLSRNNDFDGSLRERDNALSKEFWESYEEINRQLMPVDPVYSGTRGGVTVATANDFWTLSSPASGQLRLLESYVGGEASSSTILRMAVQSSTTGTTATNQTPEKFNTRSPAAASTFATTWSVQPTLTGQPKIFHAFNAFGGTDRWIPNLDKELFLVNAELFSARSASGTPTISGHAIWEEF